jgi:hypothetical protein
MFHFAIPTSVGLVLGLFSSGIWDICVVLGIKTDMGKFREEEGLSSEEENHSPKSSGRSPLIFLLALGHVCIPLSKDMAIRTKKDNWKIQSFEEEEGANGSVFHTPNFESL